MENTCTGNNKILFEIAQTTQGSGGLDVWILIDILTKLRKGR